MTFLKSTIQLRNRIKELEDNLQKLENDTVEKTGKIKKLEEDYRKLTAENKMYVDKYEHTGRECEYCYFILQSGFNYCPNCGKRIEEKIEKIDQIDSKMFKTEPDKDGCLITDYIGFSDEKIIIPSKIDGKKVIGIWNDVFADCEKLEEVIIEEGCQYIGNNAFSNCKNLRKIKFPKSIKEIGSSAFEGNINLEEIIIPTGVSEIGSCAFYKCNKLKRIILPENIKVIRSSLLSNTSIEEINIPESVLVIEYGAFSETEIRKVALPKNLYSIQAHAFRNCNLLEEIIIHSNVKIMEEDIFDKTVDHIIYGEKSTDLKIFCAAGSKAQLYARKYHIECMEIPRVEASKEDIGYSGIAIEPHYGYRDKISMEMLIKMADVSKASAYAWSEWKTTGANIHRYFSKQEGWNFKDKMEIEFSRYNGQSIGENSKFGYLSISLWDDWGKSDV